MGYRYSQDSADQLLRELYNTQEWNSELGRFEYDEEAFEAKQEAYQAHKEKLSSVGVIYSKADSIITGDKIEVRVDDSPELETTAYNDGKAIVFNAHLLEDIDDNTIVSLHGFNYHEVAHVLYTPRANSELGQWVIEQGYRRAMNILEDSRIERLIVAKYPAVQPFVEASTLDYILKGDSSEWASLFILITGRKYLDYDIRQDIATRFAKQFGKATAIALADIIHEYRTLAFPSDYDRAKRLIAEFAKYVGNDEQNPPPIVPQNGNGSCDGHIDRQMMRKGRAEGNKEQQRLQDKANASEQNSKREEFNGDNGDKEVGDGAQGVGDQITTKEVQDEFSDEDKALKDKINAELSNIRNNDNVRRDTAEVRRAIMDNDVMRSGVKSANYKYMSVPMTANASARRFASELERIRIDNDPAWELEKESGRLNIQRAMHSDINDINKLFDRWSEGNSANDIEAVILVDTSGSMGGRIYKTMETAWILKRGIERINGRVTVYKFNHDSRIIYKADEKAKADEFRFVDSSGSTNPFKALMEAERVLNSSRKNIKICFMITDGEWDSTDVNNGIISRMNNAGVLTSVVFLGNLNYVKEHDRERYEEYLITLRHGAKFFRIVDEAKDILDVAKDLVKSQMRSRH
jgi:hypothetical protein